MSLDCRYIPPPPIMLAYSFEHHSDSERVVFRGHIKLSMRSKCLVKLYVSLIRPRSVIPLSIISGTVNRKRS